MIFLARYHTSALTLGRASGRTLTPRSKTSYLDPAIRTGGTSALRVALLAVSSIAIWLLLSQWSKAPTLHPLSVELPTELEAHSLYRFRINSADRYFISIACKPEGPLKVVSAGQEEAREIPCNLWLVLS